LGNEVPFSNQWRVLYYGSQLEFKTWGPFMLDVIDGTMTSFPCFGESSQQYSIPQH
jgi:hypothetical protein